MVLSVFYNWDEGWNRMKQDIETGRCIFRVFNRNVSLLSILRQTKKNKILLYLHMKKRENGKRA